MNKIAQLEALILDHKEYANNCLSLIASENFHYDDCTMQSIVGDPYLNDKYAEGFIGKRYYTGCSKIDDIELWSENQAKKTYGAAYANLQPLSGSQANQAVYAGLLQVGDTILSLNLQNGGHLSHGHSVNFSSQLYKIVHYGLDEHNLINYGEIEQLSLRYKPQLIIAGFSVFSYVIDWATISSIAQKCNSYFLADIAHVGGLVAGQVYPNPIHHADVVTMTTHKTLGGPRGGIILTNHQTIDKKVRKGVFPMIQGGPNIASIAAKGYAMYIASTQQFKKQMARVVSNARYLAQVLLNNHIDLVWDDIHTHIVMIDLRGKSLTGAEVEIALENCGIWTNRNQVPNDPHGPLVTSGIRLGTTALTSMHATQDDILSIGSIIAIVINNMRDGDLTSTTMQNLSSKVATIANRLKGRAE